LAVPPRCFLSTPGFYASLYRAYEHNALGIIDNKTTTGTPLDHQAVTQPA